MNNEPFGLITTSGAEATSDDRGMKLILRRWTSFSDPFGQDAFISYCYVREGAGWQKTENTAQYASVEAFVRAVERFPGFSKATEELTKETNEQSKK